MDNDGHASGKQALQHHVHVLFRPIGLRNYSLTWGNTIPSVPKMLKWLHAILNFLYLLILKIMFHRTKFILYIFNIRIEWYRHFNNTLSQKGESIRIISVTINGSSWGLQGTNIIFNMIIIFSMGEHNIKDVWYDKRSSIVIFVVCISFVWITLHLLISNYEGFEVFG